MSDQNELPSLANVIRSAIESRLAEVHVSLPAKVLKYYEEEQRADVQPQLMRKYMDGTLMPLPTILNVPVAHPRSGNAIIHLPIEPNDIVQLVFCERSLDKWLAQGGITDPEDPRKHSLSDAWAYPGGYPFGKAIVPGDPKAIEMKNKEVELRVRSDGKVSIKAEEILLGDHSLTEKVAIASRVEARVAACEAGISQIVQDFTTHVTSIYTGHTHLESLPPATPTGPAVPPGVPPTAFSADSSVIGSDTVKLEV